MAHSDMNIISYTNARAGLKQLMDEVCIDHEPAVITRQSGDPVVVLSLSDFKSLEETLYLLSSQANVNHLKKSISELGSGKIIYKEPVNVTEETETEAED
ncbi:prevent-host-death family protein [Alcanivorax jadensis T9]|uniref:Antitoxin n=1 Tax=Alcanivorax jadensis T9 TaxID=1177181 RepID=A0ABR4WCG8_9GAMM|nr:type II toxin-antitoxin system prevent-host-death family antitoxin [Alcanivorax jadensis]KGD60730.1 prevent-host-death family protein [Alcanivorax jadensis T9]